MSTSTSAPVAVSDSGIGMAGSMAALWTGPLIGFVVTFAGTLFLLRDTVFSLITIWSNSRTYSYGFVVIPISAILIWRDRGRVKQVEPAISLGGLVCLAVAVFLWLAGNIADVQLVQHVALIAIFDSLVWTFLGSAVARTLVFPLFFLFLAVPVGDGLVPLLQRWTAAFTVSALHLSGIPAVQDGFLISTPSGDWQVAEACSGIRYLLASIVIGVLVAGVAYRSWKRRIAFLLLSAALPIGANAVRAYGIIVLAYLSGNAIATGVDHVLYGFLFFSFLTAVLIVAGMKSYQPEVETPGATVVARRVHHRSAGKLIFIGLMVIALMLTATACAKRVWRQTEMTSVPDMISPPAGWIQVPNDIDQEWAPDPASVQSRDIRSYASVSGTVAVCFIQYPNARRGVELINSFNLIGRSATWTVVSTAHKSAVIHGKAVSISEYVVSHGPLRRLVWLWYEIGETTTSDPYRLRLAQATNRLLGLPDSTSVYVISTTLGGEPAEAERTLSTFVK